MCVSASTFFSLFLFFGDRGFSCNLGMRYCNFLETASESITAWQRLNSPTRVYRVIGMFTCCPQLQTENMNFKWRIIQDQEESNIYIKCWK